ncbi:diguanylate cyclase (GGDEF)-like protein [Paenibacillus cellulosilyticus]|uniref:Diguanylate cyclase (GGDEF)-like protein n=1 Tax=Paenibacillus cellulosilyticus TaxID=375489 RepID=A0A2V2Z5Q2_9BACL|nr:sensor domain-containing diguanylate cyclase [Paenibacillus cellulosilyticus]PWW06170.1 diguanylate cyclase (GGDEF)-like protein [Paenibacillus cellulosilyticus]QKS43063.1 GGDEF domain-containing protein [Paenibacillus cellulosilyticus]
MRDFSSNAEVSASSPARLQELWYEFEDINDNDIPYLIALLKDSFHDWMAESNGLPLFSQSALYLISPDMIVISTAGTVRDETSQIAVAQRAACLSFDTHVIEKVEHDGWLAVAVPIMRRTDNSLPFVVITACAEVVDEAITAQLQSASFHLRNCFYRRFERMFVKDILKAQRESEQEANNRASWFAAAKRLYDGIDVASVLSEMMNSLITLYPESQIRLYLSQDHLEGDPRVQSLQFNHPTGDFVAKSFLEAKPNSRMREHGQMDVVVPMTGKQAVYGVLRLKLPATQWNHADFTALTLLADTAGNAFENAKLYEQSNVMIGELRLINELTKRLNQSLKLKDVFHYTTSELIRIYEADCCCLLSYDPLQQQFVVMSSSLPSFENEHFSTEYGFTGVVYRSQEPVIISDYLINNSVSSRWMDETGSRSLIAAPILAGSEVAGIILVGHRMPHYFSYDNYKLLQVLSSHIGLAMSNASLHAEVRRMVITDHLTNLSARHYLNDRIQRKQRTDRCGSLILVDIDKFKDVNDTFGHQVGDRILVQVADIIKSSIRGTDTAARWGGEEMAVYLPEIRREQAYRIAERIRMKVEEETDPKVTVSCGLSEWTFEDEKVSVEALFYRADMALYQAKHNGRNCIYVG